MEKNRSTKIVAIAALFVAVIGLSIGFAAFSSTLTISQSAEVTPLATTWDVRLSSSATDFGTNTVPGQSGGSDLSVIPETVTDANNALTANAATITTTNTTSDTISGLKAHFTEPGQTVTYTFYVVNGGKYDAYLKSVTFNSVSGSNPASTKVCTPGAGTDAASVTAACDDITYSISINGVPYDTTNGSINSGSAIGLWDGTSNKLSHTVVVTITYAANGDRADGPFTIAFGDIVLGYNAVPYSG